MPRIAAASDGNQKAIVKGLRAFGATVQLLHTVGKGCPDILVGYRGGNFLLEIKMPKGTLTPDQEVWHVNWNGQKAVVRSLDEAMAAIGMKFD